MTSEINIIPASLRRDYLLSLPTEEDTEQTLVQKLQQLYHYRHDLVHFLCEKILGIKSNFETLKKLSSFFVDIPEHFKNLSPDIVIERDNKITFIDISVSGNFEYNLNNKKAKYVPVLDYLGDKGYETNEFYMFWVNPLWTNLDNSLNNLYIFLEQNNITYYKATNKLLDTLKMSHEEVSTKIQEVRLRTPVEALNFFDHIDAPAPDILETKVLREKCQKNYPHFQETINFLDDTTLEETEQLFTQLVEDIEIQDILKDEKHDHLMYNRAFEHLEQAESSYPLGEEKPSFFIPYASCSGSLLEFLSKERFTHLVNSSSFKPEQCQVINFLNTLEVLSPMLKSPCFSFLKHLRSNLIDCLQHKSEAFIYNTGMLTGNIEDEVLLSKEYLEYRKANDSSVSKRTFFKNKIKDNDLKDTLPYIYRNKCIKIENINGLPREFLNKSGTSYKKTHTMREYQEKTTITYDSYKHIEDFVELLEGNTEMPYMTHSFLGTESGCDSPELLAVKEKLLIEQRKFLGLVQHTHCHSMSKHSSLVAAQLLHFNELNTTDNTYCAFTSGQPNLLHIVRGGSIKRGADIGQAFFTVFITDNIKWCSKVYGKIEVHEIKANNNIYYVCRTPWVRLTSERLSFMKDQYYSTLSTAYDTWARNKIFVGANGFLTHMYTFRTLVSLCPSQRVAELLMDTRYIFMSALSVFSNVEKLIIDKFAPPYKSCFEQYIVRQLGKKSQQIIIYLAANPPKPNKPGFSGKDRLNHTLGGDITLPSLWSDFVLQDLQSIFDDIFVYVHTSKEPSSEYHEQIKAMNTILKYQREFNSLPIQMKTGINKFQDLKEWLLSESQVGCSTQVIFNGTKLFASKYTGLHKSWEFKNNCLEEPLCNIVSTKSCIPEYERVETTIEHTKKNYDKVVKNINSLMRSGKAQYLLNSKPVLKTFCVMDVNNEEDTSIVITKQNRVKVHDALIDWIHRYGLQKNYVIELASWNIKENNCKVLTDTCIKAQYGAKREFYVINLGAKAMARVTENSYKSLAKSCKNEMISIPGDRKLTYIQDAINESILSSERRQDSLFYVNGDCTKWSACETMASFIAMNYGLKDVFGETITGYNFITFTSWANKQIQIPQTILNNLRFISNATSYLEDGTTIHSTQNFLQGMFNYSSSIKAVISTEFALHMFKKNNPNVFLHCSHLEHSDDYSLIVRTTNIESFEKFRVYHKLSQKLFGINDSTKKTNIQKHIQEFISLFSFNGQLYYPYIKKTKEVGTNLPCTDYRSDVMSIVSRVSECVRIGVSLESAYFMQRIHCASVADAYSISPGMRNSVGTTYDIFSRPIEIFGLPDTLPLLSVVVKGSSENYRLYHYGKHNQKGLIQSLFVTGQSTYDLLDLPITTIKEEMGELYNPRFSYPTRHNRIKIIREKMSFKYEDALNYFSENLTDSIVKPVETIRFYKWMQAMYFNNSFVKAYMRVSRSAMTLRHSMFSSKPCILELHSHLSGAKGNDREYTTIRNFIINFLTEHNVFNKYFTETQEKLLMNNINCYNNCIELLYKLTSGSVLVERNLIDVHTTVNKMPDPFIWLNMENNVTNILQFLINPDNFYKDRRTFISETSLGRDIKKLSKYYDINLLKKSSSYCRQIFSEITSQGNNRAYGLTFVNNVTDLPTFIRQYFEYGLLYGKTFNMIPTQKVELVNIKDGSHFFTRDWKTNQNIQTGLLSQLALVYRCIVLRSGDMLQQNLKSLLQCKIPDLDTNVKDFLTDTNLSTLNTLQTGELTRKILCFLKSKLLNDSLDLQQFINSKFFYEVYYVPSRQVLKPFKEMAIINFLGIKYRAYLYEEGTKKYLFLEIKNTNRVYWFYCYSIAQRVFGIINQLTLDERLLETKDFIIPRTPQELRYLLKEIGISKYEPMYYKKMNKVFKQTRDWQDADLPIVVQDVKVYLHFATKTQKLNSSRINVTDLSVFTGNIKLFKLPFGNLIYQNYFDINDENLQNISIDNLSIKFLIEHNLLEPYLKNKMNHLIKEHDILEIIPKVIKNLHNIDNFPKKFFELNKVFDLDLISFQPTKLYEPKEETQPVKTDFPMKQGIADDEIQLVSSLSEDTLQQKLFGKLNLFQPKTKVLAKKPTPKETTQLSILNYNDIELTAVDELSIDTNQELVTAKEETNMLNLLFDADAYSVDIPEMVETKNKPILKPKLQIQTPSLDIELPDLEEKPISIGTQLSEDELKSKMSGLFSFSQPKSEPSQVSLKAPTFDFGNFDFMPEQPLELSYEDEEKSETKEESSNESNTEEESSNIEYTGSITIENIVNLPDIPNIELTSIEKQPISEPKFGNPLSESALTGMFNFSNINMGLQLESPKIEMPKTVKPIIELTMPTVELENTLDESHVKIEQPIIELDTMNFDIQDIESNIAEKTSAGTQLQESFLSNILNNALTASAIEIDETQDNIDHQLLDVQDNIGIEIVGFEQMEQSLAGISARQMFNDYASLIPLRTLSTGQKISERQLGSIEETRKLYVDLKDLEEDEVGELFEMPEEIIEYERSVSSGSSSSDSDGISWYQLIPSTQLIEGNYNFDLKCIKSMLNLNEYLLKLVVEKDVQELLMHKSDLGTLVTLINFVGQNMKNLNLNKGLKSLLVAVVRSLKQILQFNNNTVYSFGTNMGIKWKKGKISFVALKGFENKQRALEIASANPQITFERDCRNNAQDIFWLSAPLFQDDLNDHFERGFQTETLTQRTTLSNMISQLIPRLKKTEFKLKGNYGF